jgi:hypothetical protein
VARQLNIPSPRSRCGWVQRTSTEMALHILAYNLTRVMNILGIQPLMAAMRAKSPPHAVRSPLKTPHTPNSHRPQIVNVPSGRFRSTKTLADMGGLLLCGLAMSLIIAVTTA